MKTHFRRMMLMVQFYTRIPIPVALECSNEDFGKALAFAPLVGVLIGLLLAGFHALVGLVFPVALSAVLTVVFYILLTGGLHLDGLGDTFDGLFSGRSRERMLEIMKDSRVGTNAVLALVCVLLLNAGALASMKPVHFLPALLLAPVAGRLAALLGAALFPYARPEGGLGQAFVDACGLTELLIGGLVAALAAVWGFGLPGLAVMAGITGLSWLMLRGFSSKIGGVTGDVLGAVTELAQMLCLLCFVLF